MSSRLKHKWFLFSVFMLAVLILLREWAAEPKTSVNFAEVKIPITPIEFSKVEPISFLGTMESKEALERSIDEARNKLRHLGQEQLLKHPGLDESGEYESPLADAVTASHLSSAWVIQLARLKSLPRANSLSDGLQGAGFRSFVETITTKNEGDEFLVLVGPVIELEEAMRLHVQLENLSLNTNETFETAHIRPFIP